MTEAPIWHWIRKKLREPWGVSIVLHVGLVGTSVFTGWLLSRPASVTVPIEVLQMPRQMTQQPLSVRTRPQAEQKTPPKKKARAVFGQSRRAQTVEDSTAPSVKAGNTLAKEQDNKVLRKDDPDYLPEPVEEFLVSRMPVLRDEVIVPYPAAARERGVEGAVLMDILIDEKGRVRDARLLSGPDSLLSAAAMKAVLAFEFEPAEVEGKPVPVRIRYAYRFVLER